MRTVILIRHGEYEHDEDCDEDVGCGLVVLGRQQARLTGDRLKAMPIANCSLTVVQVRADGSKKLIAFADSGHIPYSMTTYPGTEAAQ